MEDKVWCHLDKQSDTRKDNFIFLTREEAIELLPRSMGFCSEYIEQINPSDNDIVKIRFKDLKRFSQEKCPDCDKEIEIVNLGVEGSYYTCPCGYEREVNPVIENG